MSDDLCLSCFVYMLRFLSQFRMTLSTQWSKCGCLWGERSSWGVLWNSIGQSEHAAKEDGSKLRWGVCAVTCRNGDRHAMDQSEMDKLQGDCKERANTFRTKLWIHTFMRKLVRTKERTGQWAEWMWSHDEEKEALLNIQFKVISAYTLYILDKKFKTYHF